MIPKLHFSQWFTYTSWEQKLTYTGLSRIYDTPKKSHVSIYIVIHQKRECSMTLEYKEQIGRQFLPSCLLEVWLIW